MLDLSQDSMPQTHEGSLFMRRRRYQKGSLQKRKHGRFRMWVALWWQDGSRRYRTLGSCFKMSQGEARLALDAILQPLNRTAQDGQDTKYTLGEFVTTKYLPFCLRKWKESTAQTTKQRIEHNLVAELGNVQLEKLDREQLQDFLEQRVAAGLSASVVSHLRWDLRAIFQLAVEDGAVDRNQATSLVTPAN